MATAQVCWGKMQCHAEQNDFTIIMSLLSNDARLNQTVMESSTQEGASNLLLNFKDKGSCTDKTGADLAPWTS